MDSDDEDEDDTSNDVLLRISKIKAFCSPVLQHYMHSPPGVGMAVVYVAVNIDDGNVYVGKHTHGKSGVSVASSRRKYHESPPDSVNTYFSRAMRKHGKDRFDWFIIWHGGDQVCGEIEQYWISTNGLNSKCDEGGWGYNHREGGEGEGAHSQSTIELLKIRASDPERRRLQASNTQAYWDSLSTDDRRRRSEKRKRTITTQQRETHRKNALIQKERELSEGKIAPLSERGKAHRTNEWSDEQWSRAIQSRMATTAKRRAAVLDKLPEEDREAKQREYERNERKEANRKGKAAALVKLPEYEDKGLRWCYYNLSIAMSNGIVFSKNSDGMWCACAGV